MFAEELNSLSYTARYVVSGPLSFIAEGHECDTDLILVPGWKGDLRNVDHLQVRVYSKDVLPHIADLHDVHDPDDWARMMASIWGGGAGGAAYYIHINDIKFKTVPYPDDHPITIALRKYKENQTY